MSSYLRKLLTDSPEAPEPTKPLKVKKLPIWLNGIQSQRPVTYDTSELYEDRVDELDSKKKQMQSDSKKCYECGEFGHIAKECPNKWKKKLGGRFKESDWCCAMCGNINWDWRQHCNKCSTPKPTGCNAEKRTGRGGGYNEIDEETRKRLQSKKNANDSKKKTQKNNNKSYPIHRDYDPVIYISNLPNIEDDEELINKIAQLFGQIGRIKKHYHKGRKYNIRLSNNNRNARLVYEDSHTAPFAIQWFNSTQFEENTICVKLRKDVNPSEYHEFEIYEDDEEDEYVYDRRKKKRNDANDDEEEDDDDEDRNAMNKQLDEDENEMANIEAELFGYSRRGRGGKRNVSGRRKVFHKNRDRSRSRDREKERERERYRGRNRERYSAKKSRRYR